MEEAGALVESAVVSLEAVFKVEANLVAVAEIFRALQAEAGAGVLTGTHAEAVGRGLAVVDLRPVETEVNETIELNVGSESRAGKGTENGDGSERLLEHLHFLIFWVRSGPDRPARERRRKLPEGLRRDGTHAFALRLHRGPVFSQDL